MIWQDLQYHWMLPITSFLGISYFKTGYLWFYQSSFEIWIMTCIILEIWFKSLEPRLIGPKKKELTTAIINQLNP